MGVASLLTLSTPSRAAEPIAVSVRVEAPASCTTTAAFWAALARRTDRLRQARGGEGEASIEITMRADAETGGATGELRIVRAGSASEQRRLGAASCDELTQGMSLVAALAFDPAARLEAAVDDAPAAPDRTPATAPVAVPSPAPGAPRETPTNPPRDGSPALRLGIGGSAGVAGMSADGATPVLGGFVDLQHQRGLLTTARLGITRQDASVTREAVGAELAWTLGRASVCPLRVPLNARASVSLMPCAGIEVGVLSAAARGVSRADDRSRLWFAASAMGRFEVQPVRSFFVEAQVGAGFPLIRDEIAVDPSLTLYRAPAVIAFGEIGAGVRFP